MPFTMGESFVLVAPQRREMLRCNGCYDIFRQLFGGRATGLVRHLCIPILPARENLTVPVSTNRVLSRLETLPTELHEQIFSHLNTANDAFFFGLVSRYFRLLSLPYIDVLRSSLGSWAGYKLINVGQNADMYPDGLLSPSEISEVVEFTLAKFCEGDDYATEFAEDPPTSLHCFAIDEYNPITDIPADARFLPSDRLWVLRNLTARVYVRADKLAIGEGLVEGPVIRCIGFGEVVVMKTCWPGVHESGVPGVGQGEWAGNCFDITRIDMVRGDGWKDVSDEVVALIGAVWEASFGQDWKKVVLDCEKE